MYLSDVERALESTEERARELALFPDVLNKVQQDLRKSIEPLEKLAELATPAIWFKLSSQERKNMVDSSIHFDNFALVMEESLRQNKNFLNPAIAAVYERDVHGFVTGVLKLRTAINNNLAVELERRAAADKAGLDGHERGKRDIDEGLGVTYSAEEFRQRFQ